MPSKPRLSKNSSELLAAQVVKGKSLLNNLNRMIFRLLDLLVILVHVQDGRRISHRALICTDQCYITRQVGQEPSTVIQRIVYRSLRNIQPAIKTESGLVKIGNPK
jgi:hypothetical protein